MKKKLSIGLLFILLGLQVTAFSQKVNQAVLDKILQRAKETNSDSLLILQNGKPIIEHYAGDKNEKIEIMSCTKSIVALAVAKLVEQGKIKSFDQPVYEFYPEWKQGKKASITVKHLLNHTSGLQNLPNTSYEIYPSKDFVKLALAAELSDEPGARFSYNNKAVNLLAGIVQVASEKRMDVFMRDEFFAPLEIKDFDWTLDAAGNPHGMSGLQLSASDFAKLGQIILNRGKWDGKQILSEKIIDELLTQSQPFEEGSGLLWWRTSSSATYTIDDEHWHKLEKAGIEKSFLEKLLPIKGKVFVLGEQTKPLAEIFGSDWQNILTKQLANKNVPFYKKRLGEIEGYYANGYLGQTLLIVPKANIVAVRQIKNSKNYNPETDGFNDFMSLVLQLAK